MVRTTDAKHHTKPDILEPTLIAIGDNHIRRNYDIYNLQTIVHPTAFIDRSAKVAGGVFIGPGAIIHVNATIGRGAIINSSAVIEHDCEVGEWCHVAPGAVLCGTVTLGKGVFIGANSVVREGLNIAAWSVIGCGAAVVEDVTKPGTYVGVPARGMRPGRGGCL